MDEKSFRELYDTYKSKLYFFSLRFTKSTYISEEIVQEVFINIWENRNRIDPELSIKSYLFTAVRNSIINFMKKVAHDEKMQKEILEITMLENALTQEGNNDENYKKVLRNAIAKLPPKRQTIFKMAKLEGLTYEEIAQNMSIAKNTVRLQIIEANKFIKDFFNKNVDHVLSISLILSILLR